MVCYLGRMVHPDNRRGKVQIIQGDDGVPHLQWKLRPSDTKELDITLLAPVTWEKVYSSPFLLSFF